MKDKMQQEWQRIEDLAKTVIGTDWKEAVVQRCIVDCIGWQEDNPGKTVDLLIWTEILMALDPKIGPPPTFNPEQMVTLIQLMQASADRAHKDEMPLSYQEYENFARAAATFALENMVEKIQQGLKKHLTK